MRTTDEEAIAFEKIVCYLPFPRRGWWCATRHKATRRSTRREHGRNIVREPSIGTNGKGRVYRLRTGCFFFFFLSFLKSLFIGETSL